MLRPHVCCLNGHLVGQIEQVQKNTKNGHHQAGAGHSTASALWRRRPRPSLWVRHQSHVISILIQQFT